MNENLKIKLDVHAHLIPIGREQANGIPGVVWDEAGHIVVDGSPLGKRELYEPARLLEWMDRFGVQDAWVSVPPTLYRAALEADDALQWARALNQALVSLAAGFDRLAPMLHLPVQHASAAIRVAQESVASGQRLFAVPAGDARRGRMLSDSEYEPLWRCLDDAGAFLMLHPAGACDPRFARFSLPNLLGGPTETAIAAAHLAMSGVLERHPDITFCLAHGRGTFAAASGRLRRGQDTGREGAYLGGERIRDALKRFCVDCITHDAEALQFVAKTFGKERVLFGSDWPFDMGLADPHLQLEEVPAELRQRIFVDNADAVMRRMGAGVEAAR